MKPKTKSNKNGSAQDANLKAKANPDSDTSINKKNDRKSKTGAEVTNQNNAITNDEDFGQFDPTTFLM